KKPTGTLVLDALTPAKRLWMFSTGTGFAPFASLVREPETYSKFEQAYATHTCRLEEELAYSFETITDAKGDPLVGEEATAQLHHFTSCTRTPAYPVQGRITTLIENGGLCGALDVPALNPAEDRVMICGSNEMIQDTKALLEARGFVEGSNAAPADFVIEKAFAG
ncbi:MAG: ferredoxin--NADP reductase, partial [Pseudomonadota bacterium]